MTHSFVIVLREEIVLFFEQFFITTLIRLGTEPVEPRGGARVHPQPQYIFGRYIFKSREVKWNSAILSKAF